MQRKILLTMVAFLLLGTVVNASMATINKPTLWQTVGYRLKAVFFPSFFLADTTGLNATNNLTNPYANFATGTDTSGYNCVNNTCTKVSSNAKYVGGDDAKTKCVAACKSSMAGTGTSSPVNVSGNLSASSVNNSVPAASTQTGTYTKPATASTPASGWSVSGSGSTQVGGTATTPKAAGTAASGFSVSGGTVNVSPNMNISPKIETQTQIQTQNQIQLQTTPTQSTGGLWSGFITSIKDMFGVAPTKVDTSGINNSVNTVIPNKPNEWSITVGQKDEEGECKIVSITLSPKKELYEIGDKVSGVIKSSCIAGTSIKKYSAELAPENGKKGGDIVVDTNGKFSFTVDINTISMLAQAGQSGKSKLQIGVSAFFDSKTGVEKYVTDQTFITINLGDEKKGTENDDGTKVSDKIGFKVDKKEYSDLKDTIKLTIISKPANLKNCGYNIEADWRNSGKYETSKDGVDIPGCTGTISIPVNGWYKIKLSVSGTITTGNKTTQYKSDPESVEIKYNPKAPKTGDINNGSCYVRITKMVPNSNKIYVTNQQTQDVTVSFDLGDCQDYTKIDIKPTRVSAYIDIYDLHDESKKQSVECEYKTYDGKTIYQKGTEYSLKCSAKTLATLPNDAKLKLLMVDMYYNTDIETGTQHGGTHLERFTSTRDRVELVTDKKNDGKPGDGKPGTGDNILINIKLEANPSTLAEKQIFKLKITGGDVPTTAKCGVWVWTTSETTPRLVDRFVNDEMPFLSLKTFLTDLELTRSADKLEYYQVRCATPKGTDEKYYYSNKVTVGRPDTWGEICDAHKCVGKYTHDATITPDYKDGKIVGLKPFSFGTSLSGIACDLGVFQKTFMRLKIDETIIKDVEINKLEKTGKTSITNLWNLISETTKNKFSNGGKVNISVESWSTFNEKTTLTNKNINCNWGEVAKDITIPKSEGVSDKTQKQGTLTIISNPPTGSATLYRLVTKLVNNKEILTIPATPNKIENHKLNVGTYVVYSTAPTGHKVPGWGVSKDHPGYYYKTIEISEKGIILKLSFEKSNTTQPTVTETKTNPTTKQSQEERDQILLAIEMACTTNDAKKVTELIKKLPEYDVLYLPNLTSISVEIAQALTQSIAMLDLPGLNSVSIEVAKALSGHRGLGLSLGISSISTEVAQALSQYGDSNLYFDRLTSISVEVARSLSQSKASTLWFQSLTSMSVEVAESLAEYKGSSISFDKLSFISTETAQALSHYGDTSSVLMLGLTSISTDVAKALAEYKGAQLHLDNLTYMSTGAVKALAKYKGIVSAQDNIEEAIDEAKNKNIQSGDNKSICPQGYPGFTYNYNQTKNQSELKIDYSGCEISKIVEFGIKFGDYYGKHLAPSNLQKNNAILTVTTKNKITQADTTICLSGTCKKSCMYADNNGVASTPVCK